MHRAGDPLRTLSDLVGERIAAGLVGRKAVEVVALKCRVRQRDPVVLMGSLTLRLQQGVNLAAFPVACASFELRSRPEMYFMIEAMMYVGLGFLTASLLALVIIPSIHDRAVRLTVRRINAATPLSIEEIQTERDQLRAEFAMSTRRLEANVEELRAQTASQRAELGKNTATINRLNVELAEKAAAIFALEAHDRALTNQLHAAEQLLTKNGAPADHILASKLARVTADLDQRSVLADSQRIEIVALKTQIGTLKDQLALAHNGRGTAVPNRS